VSKKGKGKEKGVPTVGESNKRADIRRKQEGRNGGFMNRKGVGGPRKVQKSAEQKEKKMHENKGKRAEENLTGLRLYR